MSRLNYHHLYYFWRVAKAGSLTQVAQDVHISQSALSIQIKRLEHTMGVSLFEKQGRKLILTDAGKQVLVYADDIFYKGEELESFLLKGVATERQHLSIGVQTTLSRNFIESFISPLLCDPHISFTLTTRDMDTLLKGLSNHELDLVLTNRLASQNETRWHTQLVSRQQVAIVGPKGAGIKSDFPQGYDKVRWVLPGPTTEIRSAFNALCAAHQYTPDIQAEVDDMAMLRLLARDSGALAVLPPVVVKDEIAQGVLEQYHSQLPIFEHFYAITTSRKFVPQALLDLLKQPLA
ncbi:LysR family transcriptional regulator [Pseudoalteromonas ardens]|uniref:LysR family transcriptional regulator n=1 Tax=Pseudoalteromonas rubra TaxID=43658 RepID=A0A0L0EN25_9GAMM|nr:LysR family transcriptional regulator [Pseudoalteromonas sp. R96]KNC65882.1 LysR family transcriptional regulator [Pseudoalteromonas rubra]MDK1313118.1 LysR family transcriptional regulator [Pseudoalteromonas sp. R96]